MPIDEVNELVRPAAARGRLGHASAGSCSTCSGHVPAEGESVECEGHRLWAERVQRRRIGRVRIAPALDPATPTDDARPRLGAGPSDDEPRERRSMRSGFVTIVGRPNVGKSTLVNRILGTKVCIVSDKPQTTRTQVRGVLNRPEAQVVFVDTPGIHKPRTLLGERLNDTASETIGGVDVVCLVVDATASIGPGDRFVAARVPADGVVVVNKVDAATPEVVLAQLAKAADQLDLEHYFPVSAKTGDGRRRPGRPPDRPPARGSPALSRRHGHRRARGVLGGRAGARAAAGRDPRRAAPLDRHPGDRVGVAAHPGRDPGRARLAEGHRDRPGRLGAQGGGHRRARAQLPPGAFIELFVKVDKDWQRRPKALERLGY